MTLRRDDLIADYNRMKNAHERLVEALRDCKGELEVSLKEIGGCDHHVNVCACPTQRVYETVCAVLAELGEK